jgi:hypothetical protein
MRKAIVIGIILSIAVLIAVVVYLFNTKKEGFQSSNPQAGYYRINLPNYGYLRVNDYTYFADANKERAQIFELRPIGNNKFVLLNTSRNHNRNFFGIHSGTWVDHNVNQNDTRIPLYYESKRLKIKYGNNVYNLKVNPVSKRAEYSINDNNLLNFEKVEESDLQPELSPEKVYKIKINTNADDHKFSYNTMFVPKFLGFVKNQNYSDALNGVKYVENALTKDSPVGDKYKDYGQYVQIKGDKNQFQIIKVDPENNSCGAFNLEYKLQKAIDESDNAELDKKLKDIKEKVDDVLEFEKGKKPIKLRRWSNGLRYVKNYEDIHTYFRYDRMNKMLFVDKNSYSQIFFVSKNDINKDKRLLFGSHWYFRSYWIERTEVEFIDVTDKYNEIRTDLLRGQGKEDSNYNNIIKELNDELDELKNKKDIEQKRINQLKTNIAAEGLEFNSLINEKQKLENQIKDIQTQVYEATANKQKLIDDKKDLLDRELITINDNFKKKEADLAALKKTIEDFDNNLQTTKRELEDKAEEDKRKINETIELAEKNRDSRIETIREEGNRLIEEIESSLEEQKKIAQSRVDRERKNAEIKIKEIKQMAYSREKNAKLEAIKKVQDEIDQLNREVLAVEEEAALKIAEAEEKIKQAMANSPAKKYVKSKVNISPDIQKYINEELAKYSDKNSLPTVTQLEQLKKLSTDNSAEKLASIPGLLKKFSDNTQTYMDFHNSYEDQLKEILETKFDAEKRANIEIQNRNATRLNRLTSEITNYADVNKINLIKQEIKADTSKAGTLRNIGDGTMLNFDKTNDNKHVVLKMSGEKMVMEDGELKKDANGEIQGCLTFDSSKNRLGTPALTCCNINNKQSPELSFRVSKINNKDEYNKLLTKISPETKSLATDYDTINYPFSVVEPQLSPGYCVSVEDQKVRILPCEKESNQRYRKLNYQVKKNCGLN